MSTDTPISLPPRQVAPALPGFGAGLTLLMGALVGVSGLWGLFQALTAEVTAWIPAGFETVTVAAAAFCVLTGLGRFRDGPAMSLGVSAGTIAVAAGFGRLAVLTDIGDTLRDPTLVGRVMASALIAIVASVAVFARHSGSWPAFFRGVILSAIAVVGAGAGFWLLTRGPLSGLMEDSLRPFGWLAAAIVAVVFGLVGCAAAHFIIRAYQLGSLTTSGLLHPVPEKRAEAAAE
ncbi:MAG: hypothetical protein AAGG07_01805 [Planctomycetota bacterium]